MEDKKSRRKPRGVQQTPGHGKSQRQSKKVANAKLPKAQPKQTTPKAQPQVATPQEPEKESLTVDGSPYAPISIRKAIEHLQKQGHFDITTGDDPKSLTVFITTVVMDMILIMQILSMSLYKQSRSVNWF